MDSHKKEKRRNLYAFTIYNDMIFIGTHISPLLIIFAKMKISVGYKKFNDNFIIKM